MKTESLLQRLLGKTVVSSVCRPSHKPENVSSDLQPIGRPGAGEDYSPGSGKAETGRVPASLVSGPRASVRDATSPGSWSLTPEDISC